MEPPGSFHDRVQRLAYHRVKPLGRNLGAEARGNFNCQKNQAPAFAVRSIVRVLLASIVETGKPQPIEAMLKSARPFSAFQANV